MKCCINRTLIRALLALLIPLVSTTARGQGTLAQLRDDVRTLSPSKPEPDLEPTKPRRQSCGHFDPCNCDDDESFIGSMIGKAMEPVIVAGFVGATLPIWGPRKLVDDRFRSAGYFAEYPYHHDLDGYMMVSPFIETDPFDWSLQARSEYSTDFEDITRIGNRLLLDTKSRFGADAEFNYWRESLANLPSDSLWTGDANVLFRIAQSEQLQVRTGVGFNWLADNLATDIGFNVTYQADFFPRDPWILSGEIDWGTLGDETLFHSRASVGVQWHRVEVFTGVDYFDVDRTQIGTVVGGLRGWF